MPGLSNVLAQAAPGSTSGELHAPSGLGSFPDTALWAIVPTFIHRTVSPALMVTVIGSLKYSPIETLTVAGACVVDAAVVVVGAAVVVVVGAAVVDVVVVDVDVVVGAVVVVVEVAASVVVVDVDVEVVEVDVVVVVVSSASEELQPATSSRSAARISAAGNGRRSAERYRGSGNSVIGESGGSLPDRRTMEDQPTVRRYCRTVNGKNTTRIAAIHRSDRHP